MSKINEVLKSLFEGHSGECGPLTDMKGKPIKTKEEAMKYVEREIADQKDSEYGDTKDFRGAKWVGDVSEDRLNTLADKYEDEYVVVGLVDDEIWSAYSIRT